MLTEVLGRIDGWLGRSFMLARFFPWLLFCLGNAFLAGVAFPSVREFLLTEYQNLGSGEKLVNLAMLLAGVAVLAFTLSPLVQPITSLLEGKGLPWWLAEPLVLGHVLSRDRRLERGYRMFLRRAKLPDSKVVITRLSKDRAEGVFTRAVTNPDAIKAAQRAIRSLRATRYLNRPIEVDALQEGIDCLSKALRENCADVSRLSASAVRATRKRATRLDALHREMMFKIAKYAKDIAEAHDAREFAAYERSFAAAEVAPTRFGNDIAALRSYCETRYGFYFDFFWPRLQLVLKDEVILARLDSARIQLDFSILSLVLSGLFTVIWLVVLGFWGTSLEALLTIAIVGPLLIGLWLWIVHESFSAYAEVVKGAIDTRRFELLSALRRPLPKTVEEEPEVWRSTERLLALGERDEGIVYEHPP
ncbi:hypothetical protein [Sinorhizobium sp. BG8]|uniref:hypothetical protein n=1 Tax=Sinorhizobium sp. BG8 TaxID=2613773 RepID=UPI00193EBA08|nr:hypothetical protein [Sinorhizobium sp. BG8]QRM54782.1 hypothetical protein F3Y30_09690 [Sinorhizobium sp. BG8]